MQTHDAHTRHSMFMGVIAIVASGILALAALSFAEETSPSSQTSGDAAQGTAASGDWSHGTSTPPSQPSESCVTGWTFDSSRYQWNCPAGQPASGTVWQGGYQGDGQSQQQGPTQEQIKQALSQNGRGVCFFGSRWDGGGSPDSCAQQGGQWHGSYTQPSDQYRGGQMGQGWTPHESAPMPSDMPPMYQMDRQDHRGGPQQYHGGPMGQGGRGIMGGPMDCDEFDGMIERIEEESADRWSDMEGRMREQAEDQIDRLQEKIDDTDDEKKIAKYQKKIAKVQAKIEKQITKMKVRFEKQVAKTKARMEQERARCEEHQNEGGDDFGGGGWEGGGGGNMGPSFGW